MKITELIPLEKDECYTFVEYLRIMKIPFTHVASENVPKILQIVAKFLGISPLLINKLCINLSKFMYKIGVNKGFPDYIVCPTINGVTYILFIEMKRKKKYKVSKEQEEWIDTLIKVKGDIRAHICCGAEQAIKCIQTLYRIKPSG